MSPDIDLATALQRAEADSLNAVIRVYRASAEAAGVAAAARQAPLAGLPILLKDNLCYQGHPVEACSKILEGYVSPYTASAVQRLLDAGAVVVGAANMDEFAMGSSNETSRHGPVENPHAADRIPGGSSGGSAAAVAAGIVPVALGSDTGGSIRQPAALCGCVGFKPSYGVVSRYGLLAFGSSLDQIGPLTRTVADAARITAVMAGHDPLDGTSLQRPAPAAEPPPVALQGLRIGLISAQLAGVQPAIREAIERLLQKLRQAGAEIVEVALPHEQQAVAVYYIVATGEAASNLGRYDGVRYGRRAADCHELEEVYARSRGQGFGAEVKRRIMLGTYVLSAGYFDAYYRQAMRVRRLVCQDYAAAFAVCDCLLGPTSPTTAFRRGSRTADPLQMYLSDVFTIGANLAGLPAISLPAGCDADGLPIGVHLQAAFGDDERLLGIAAQIEALLT